MSQIRLSQAEIDQALQKPSQAPTEAIIWRVSNNSYNTGKRTGYIHGMFTGLIIGITFMTGITILYALTH